MTPEQLREAAAVMLAAADGKKIEYKCGGMWRDVVSPSKAAWDFEHYEYRIKPEPRKVAIRLHYSEWANRYAAINLDDPAPSGWKPVSDIVEIEIRDE